MAITPVSLQQAMRPAEIDAINALNEAIAELNQLDVTGLNTRLSTIESNIATIQGDLNTADTGLKARMSAAEAVNTSQQTDIDDIKVTLYTPLSANTNSNS